MAAVGKILEYLDSLAPVKLKMDFDNVGLLVGFTDDEVNTAVVALDITEEVINEARELGAQLIVSHHPLFFDLKTVSDLDPSGKKAALLIRNGMAAICMHTNLDAAKGGVNDILAEKAGIVSTQLLCEEFYDHNGEPYCIGRFGELEHEMSMDDYLACLKTSLNANGLKYYDAGRPVKKVAVVGGSGMSQIDHVLQRGCDTFLTADIKYHAFLDAREGGYNLIDGDHFCTENVVVPYLAEKLQSAFPDIDIIVSKVHSQTTKFI